MSKQDGKINWTFGAPVSDRENSMTAGQRGPLLMQDVYYLEQISHFDREVIPERRMHAKGSGAFGTFTVTNDITQYTNAKNILRSRKTNRDVCTFFYCFRRTWSSRFRT